MHILITGSTSGIGLSTARALAARGHTLYLHGRNQSKVDALVEELTDSGGRAVGVVADLAHLASIATLASDISHLTDRIDTLINNAGVLTAPPAPTSELGDVRFVVNYLAPVLLTQSLTPLLRGSSHPQLINLSSAAQSPVSLAALCGEETLSDMGAYAQSKLALTMWTAHLRADESWLSSVAVNPGSLLDTPMVRDAFGSGHAPASVGADCLVHLSEDYRGVYPELYFDNDRGSFGPAHEDAYDPTKVAALLETTQTLLARYQQTPAPSK